MRPLPLSILALVLAGASPAGFCQESVGTWTGHVQDQKAAPLANARIALDSPALLERKIAHTGPKGSFRFSHLPPGDYTATVSSNEHITVKSQFRLSAGNTLRQDFILTPLPAAGAQVTVTADRSAAQDTTEARTATVVTDTLLNQLPASRDIYGAQTLAPGLQSTFHKDFSIIRGALGGQSACQVNGISTRDPVSRAACPVDFLVSDAIEEIQIIQSPLNAKYGMTSGGIINTVTKNGANGFSGALRVKLSNEGLRARYPFEAPRKNELKKIYEFFFSGPLIQEKLSFAYACKLIPNVTETVDLRSPYSYNNLGFFTLVGKQWVPSYNYGFQLGVPRGVSGERRESLHQFKLYWQIHPDHQVEAQFATHPVRALDRQYNSLEPADTFPSVQRSENKLYGLNYRGILSPIQTLDIKWGYTRSRVYFPCGNKDPLAIQYVTKPNGQPNLGSLLNPKNNVTLWRQSPPNSPLPEKRDTIHIGCNYGLLLEGQQQSHLIDMGLEQLDEINHKGAPGIHGRTFAFMGETAQQQIVVSKLPVTRAYLFAGPQVDVLSRTRAMYVNDLWTLNRHWSLNLGLRLEYFSGSDGAGTRFESRCLSPRFECKWDMTGDNRRIWQFSYAQFRGTLSKAYWKDYEVSASNVYVTKRWNQGDNDLPYYVSLDEALNTNNYVRHQVKNPLYTLKMDPRLRPEVANELCLGYQRHYEKGGSLRLTATYRHYQDLLAEITHQGEKVNVPNPIDPTDIEKGRGVFRLINDSRTKRDYWGLETEWRMPLNDQVQVGGHWTWSRLYGTTQYGEGDGLKPPDDSFDWNAMDAGNYPWNPKGILPYSRDHVIRAWVIYSVPHGRHLSTFSLLGSYLSGLHRLGNQDQPANPLHMVDSPEYLHYYNGRGRYTQPDFWTIDFKYRWDLILMKPAAFFMEFTINNLLNRIRPVQVSHGTPHIPPDGSIPIGDVPLGWKADPDLFGKTQGIEGYFLGARSVNLQCGVKF